tara:strand:- start:369 stop:1388 length:1020 start_codon:yes stop_codon:yes gene_type:complete
MRNSVVLLGMFLLFAACNSGPKTPERQILRGDALGTTYGISYISKTPLLTSVAMDSLLQVVNQSMSTYWPDSDISRINRGDSAVLVEPMFREVFELSGLVYKASGGYFDPTVGPLVNAWGFGPEKALEMTPKRVDSLMAYVGFSKVSLLPSGKIEKSDPAIYFDFNAIAKGYTLDRIALVLDRLGVANYLIELGGELVAKGRNAISEKQWLVGIDHPKNEDRNNPIVKVQLKDRALASSGNYRKFRVDPETGEKFVHTINPLTGYSENSTTLAASVLAPSCALADGYATAFMAMGYEKAIALVATLEDIEVYLVYVNADGDLDQYMSEGFKQVVYEQAE